MKTNPNDLVNQNLRDHEEFLPGHGPLTKREYFAALAMQGLLASGAFARNTAGGIVSDSKYIADTLIEELNHETK